jgi:hypothetical protein
MKYGGHLVTIETKHKMEFVYHLAISLVTSQPILKFYIGKSIKYQSKKIKTENKRLKLLQDQFEDTKGLIRSRKFKKNSNNTMAKRKRPTGPTTT